MNLKQAKKKKQSNTGLDVNLNVYFVLWLSLVILSLWLCSVSTVWVTALSVAKLFVSLPVNGQRHPSQNKKTDCNHFSQTNWVYRLEIYCLCFSTVAETWSLFQAQPTPPRISLSSLLIILSALAETLFIWGMFQTGGFESSTTFQVFCGPRLHLFCNVWQPLNSKFAHSGVLSGKGQIRHNIWHIWGKKTNKLGNKHIHVGIFPKCIWEHLNYCTILGFMTSIVNFINLKFCQQQENKQRELLPVFDLFHWRAQLLIKPVLLCILHGSGFSPSNSSRFYLREVLKSVSAPRWPVHHPIDNTMILSSCCKTLQHHQSLTERCQPLACGPNMATSVLLFGPQNYYKSWSAGNIQHKYYRVPAGQSRQAVH